jgi:ABC-type Fe3+-hydroxamate transport system substrate-binding protein
LDKLKKEYLKLAKKYHPDAGGTTVQFQDLQNEYEKLLNKILKGSSLNEEQQENEIVIDQAIRAVIDQLVNLENVNVELIGKWLWVSGETYPIKDVLRKAGLIFIRKDEKPFWVYKGVESAGRGKLTLEQIKNKYGSVKIDLPKTKRISGFVRINKTRLLNALRKLMKGLNKRPV